MCSDGMNCEVCGKPNAQKHHIVFKSQGGFNIDLNYVYLCEEHHRGENSPHGNAECDLRLKRRMQERLYKLFADRRTYRIDEIAELVGYDRKRLKKRFCGVPNHCGEYETEDIVKKFMGGEIY